MSNELENTGGQETQLESVSETPQVESEQTETVVAEPDIETGAVENETKSDSEAERWRVEANSYRDKTFALEKKLQELEQRIPQPVAQPAVDPILAEMQNAGIIQKMQTLVAQGVIDENDAETQLQNQYMVLQQQHALNSKLAQIETVLHSTQGKGIADSLKQSIGTYGIEAGSELENATVSILKSEFGVDMNNPVQLAQANAQNPEALKKTIYFAQLMARDKANQLTSIRSNKSISVEKGGGIPATPKSDMTLKDQDEITRFYSSR